MAQRPPSSHHDRALERVFVVASPLVLLVAWEIAARTGWLDRRIFSSPSTVVTLAMDALRTG